MTRTTIYRRRGFTLVELLTAIAIIAILISMVFLGIKHISGRARDDQTHGSMELAKSLMSDYLQAGGNSRIDEFYEPWNTAHTARLLTYFTPGDKPPHQVKAPFNMREGQSNRFGPEAMATHRFLRAAATIPDCAKILTNLPAAAKVYPEYTSGMTYIFGDELTKDGKFYRLTGNTTTTTAPPSSPWTQAPNITPLIMDGEKNIILVIPGDGFAVNKFGGTRNPGTGQLTPLNFRVTSVRPVDPTTDTTTVGKPFFASGGPDGDYQTGEDNAYSFDK